MSRNDKIKEIADARLTSAEYTAIFYAAMNSLKEYADTSPASPEYQLFLKIDSIMWDAH